MSDVDPGAGRLKPKGSTMADSSQGLSDQERAELEQLRAEKARREAQAQAQAERAELERLRAEQANAEADAAHAARVEAARQRMEPGEDYAMPVAQKIVLLICAVLFIAAIVYVVTAPK